MDNSTTWNIINKFFEDNPKALLRHQLESFNDFYSKGIFQIFKEKNPVTIVSRLDEKKNEYRSVCNLYFGGKEGMYSCMVLSSK